MISKLRRAGSAFSDGAITAKRNETYERDRCMIRARTHCIRSAVIKRVFQRSVRARRRMWQALQEGRTIVMGDGLVCNRGSEMVSRDLEGTTFATVAGFPDANCLNVIGDVQRGGTTTASGASGTTPTGSTSSRWWSTAAAAATSGCRRGTRGHDGEVTARCDRVIG